ncbi:hypothetical protein ACLB1O_25765 [Escherichia coli]
MMEEILALRHELAQLLGFESYALNPLPLKWQKTRSRCWIS